MTRPPIALSPARDVIIPALRRDAPGDVEPPLELGILGVGGERIGQCRGGSRRDGRLRDAGAAEHDDRVGDFVLVEQRLRLQVIEHQPHAAHVAALQEIRIAIGPAVARAVDDGFGLGRRLRIL